MKTIVLGDTHHRNTWEQIVEKESFDKIIFIGDYFDSRENISFIEGITNFKHIVQFKKNNPEKVILLIGNHDYHYFPFVHESYSGFNGNYKITIGSTLMENFNELQMCYIQDNICFTHAGLTKYFLKRFNITEGENLQQQINDLWLYKPLSFNFNGSDPYGDNITQSCIWVRPNSLRKDSINMIQVVGHTTHSSISSKHINEARDRIWCIDTLGTSGEYLIIQDGEFKIGKI